MAIDDKLAQAKFLVESDERQRGPGLNVAVELLRLCNSIPVLKDLLAPAAEPLQALLETFQKWRLDNVRYLVDIIIERLQEVGKEVDSISEGHRNFIENDWAKLVLDGVAKAQHARAKERVRRLGLILSHAYFEGDKKSADLTEEMMRIATGLDDDDVRVLDWLCEGMRRCYNPATGQVGFEEANDFWGNREHNQGQFAGQGKMLYGLNIAGVMTCCAKLQGFGLVLQVRQNTGKTFAILPYSPLKRGYEFLEYIARAGQAKSS
jgi:hypothetical protein